jgi:O-antigen/teichoic acid export membrane protein
LRPFDTAGEFHPVATGSKLRRVAVRGAGISILAAGVAFLAQVVWTMVLARLLTPSDFGVVTMVNTFSLLLCSFGWSGFMEVVLQRESITDSLASNLFWITVGGGVILTVFFACLGPLLARFYHDSLVRDVTIGMSLTIITSSTSVIHSSLLNRATRYKAVSINGLVARLVGFLVSIILALAGWSYWALVAGNIVEQVSKSLGTFFLCPWIPSLPRKVPGTAEAVKFAMSIYMRRCFSYASGNADNLLVGWRFGAAALGFYKRAFDLFWLPANQLLAPMTAIAVGTLSRFSQDRAGYQRHFLAGISSLAFVGMGIGADFALVGKDMILFLLGPRWVEAGRIFTIFGLGIGVMMLYQTHVWIHVSIGRPDRSFRWGIFEFIWTVGLFVIALPWGPRGIAAAWTISFFTLIVPAFWYAGKPIGLRAMSIVSVTWKFLVASALAGFGSMWLIQVAPLFANTSGSIGAFERAISNSVLFFALYLLAVLILHRSFAPFRQSALLIKEMLPERFATRLKFAEPTVTLESQA